MSVEYEAFLARKAQWNEGNGFEPTIMPDYLMPFQPFLTTLRRRRIRAIYVREARSSCLGV